MALAPGVDSVEMQTMLDLFPNLSAEMVLATVARVSSLVAEHQAKATAGSDWRCACHNLSSHFPVYVDIV